MRSLNLPLRLLTENEIFRLSVWGNPTNDAKKGGDLVGNTERTLLDVSDAIVAMKRADIFFRHLGLLSSEPSGVSTQRLPFISQSALKMQPFGMRLENSFALTPSMFSISQRLSHS